jgi:hypothetical protein
VSYGRNLKEPFIDERLQLDVVEFREQHYWVYDSRVLWKDKKIGLVLVVVER